MFRVGIGYDAHRLVEGRRLVIGGIEIPYDKGLLGHSDADVLLHAICDALLGALGLGDIGELFPDSDEKLKGISSILLLKEVSSLVKSKGYRVLSVDSVVVAQRPKLKPFRRQMVERISSTLEIDPSRVSVKFTTTEGMGFEGRQEGISAQAVVLVGEVGKW